MNDVSIIIVNWNARDVLFRCLAALEKQTEPCREVIVVDNNSTDGSASAIEKRFPRVRIVRSETNLGFAEGSNLGVRSVSGTWVALLNPDAFPAPDWLARLLCAARLHAGNACFGSLMLSADSPDILDGTGDVYHVSGRVWRAGKGELVSKAPRQAAPIFSPCAAAALYRREAFLEAGGFDESFFCYLEDVDLGFRLRLFGYKCLYVPDAVVHHVGSATTGGQHSDFSVYHGHRNLVWTFVKNMPGALFWLLLPLHLMMNVFAVIWFMARGQSRVIVRAKWDAIKGMPKVWAERQKIQARRVAKVKDIWRVLDKRVI